MQPAPLSSAVSGLLLARLSACPDTAVHCVVERFPFFAQLLGCLCSLHVSRSLVRLSCDTQPMLCILLKVLLLLSVHLQ